MKVAVVVLGAAVIGLAATWRTPSVNTHKCVAPCTIALPADTLEDEFGVDYGWNDKHHSVVDIYFTGHNVAPVLVNFCRSHTKTQDAYMECVKNV